MIATMLAAALVASAAAALAVAPVAALAAVPVAALAAVPVAALAAVPVAVLAAAADTWALLDPWFLLVIPVGILVALWRLRRPRAALPVASLSLLQGLPKSLATRLVALPLVLEVLAASFLGLALARPVTRDLLPMREIGVDLMLLIDVSSSMRAPDMDDEQTVTRMKAVREKALAFAAGRPHDRLGLMTFALFPELRCPLTLDQQALSAFLRTLETVNPKSEEDRTAIGVGLAQAVQFLSASKAKSKVVVLLTDGQNNVQEILPLDAAKLAKDAQIRVHTIGAGRGVQDMLGRMHEIDFKEIEQIAETTGGRFFRAKSADDLATIYAEIDRMEKVELEDPRYRTSEWFLWPLACGGGLLLLALLLEALWLRGAP